MEQQLAQNNALIDRTQNNASADAWFLSDKFKAGLVYKQLASMEYTYVIGMDVGAGESMIYMAAKRKRQDGDADDITPRSIMENGKVLSALCFDNGKTIIGKSAFNRPKFYLDFKKSPNKWNREYDSQHTYRDLMKAFIEKLWKQTLKNNGAELRKAVEEQKVLLTVGCPASPEWTDPKSIQDYQKLLIEATGCEHVAVLPESTAAIMSAMQESYISGEDIDYSKGIAIYDAGSSTIDFTFVLVGKVLITRSYPIGGHKLDEMMLQKVLDDKGITGNQVAYEQKSDSLVELRTAKEEFYTELYPLKERKLNITLPNVPVVSYKIDNDFMDKVVNKEFKRNGDLDDDNSSATWIGLCREFINQTLLDIKGYDCGKVIITGGTSQVSQLREVIEKAYPGKVAPANNPAASVARGLCYAKSLEMNGRDHVEAFKENINSIADKGYEYFVKALASYVAPVVCDETQSAAAYMYANDITPRTVNKLADIIASEAGYNAALNGDTWKNKVCELFAEAFNSVQTEIYNEVNETSKKIYKPTIDSTPAELIAVNRDRIENVNIAAALNKAWIVEALPYTLKAAMSLFVGLLFNMIPIKNEKYSDWVSKKFEKGNVMLSTNQLTDFIADTNRESIISRMSRILYKEILNSKIGKEEFVSYVDCQAEIALGKVLFLVFDEKPNQA